MGPLGTNFSEILNKILGVCLKMSAILFKFQSIIYIFSICHSNIAPSTLGPTLPTQIKFNLNMDK